MEMTFYCFSNISCMSITIQISSLHLLSSSAESMHRKLSSQTKFPYGEGACFIRFVFLIYCTHLAVLHYKCPCFSSLSAAALRAHLHFLPPSSAEQSPKMNIPLSCSAPKCFLLLNKAVFHLDFNVLSTNINYLCMHELLFLNLLVHQGHLGIERISPSLVCACSIVFCCVAFLFSTSPDTTSLHEYIPPFL